MDDASDRVRQIERDIADLRVLFAELKITVAEIRNDAIEFNRNAVQAQLDAVRGNGEITKQILALRTIIDRGRWTLRLIIWAGAGVVTLANLWEKIVAIFHWTR